MLCGRKKRSLILAATTETARQIQSLKEMAGLVCKRSLGQGRGQELAEIMRLMSQHFLADRPPFLEELSDEESPVMEGLHFNIQI